MNLLVIQGRPPYPLRLDGAAKVTHRLLRALKSTGAVDPIWMGRVHSLDQLTSLLPCDSDWRGLGIRAIEQTRTGFALDVGYPCEVTTELWHRFHSRLHRERPSLVWASLENASQLVVESRTLGIPSMLYVMDAEYASSELRRAAQAGAGIACLSRFLASHVQSTTGCRTDLLYPIVDVAPPIQPTRRGPGSGYILMVNGYLQKGVRTFLRIAELLPHVPFVLQESWPLDQKALQWLHRCVARLHNVTFRRAVAHMDPTYAGASLLVVPSIWQEGFGMVSVEAQAAGVPVIASRRGGLPESVGSGGLLVDDYENPREWARTIEGVLCDSRLYTGLVAEARVSIRRAEFSERSVVDAFCRIAEACKARV